MIPLDILKNRIIKVKYSENPQGTSRDKVCITPVITALNFKNVFILHSRVGKKRNRLFFCYSIVHIRWCKTITLFLKRPTPEGFFWFSDPLLHCHLHCYVITSPHLLPLGGKRRHFRRVIGKENGRGH